MDAIKVGIRVRPLIKREDERGIQWMFNSNSVYEKGTSTPYYFDHVFGMDSTNSVIFDTLVEPIIQSVMEGFNGTVFAYGQTSSGKTHTMMGGERDAGVIPLSIVRIFEYIQSHPERDFLMYASFMEIYNEKLTDLLNPDNKDLKIREDSEHLVKVLGITEKNTETFEDVANLLRIGQSFRSVGETQLNERSSRSHTIFTLTVESELKEEKDAVKVSTLNLVDLAGSERAAAAGTEGMRFKEGTYINLSLLTLGNVISKLSNGSSHVPFRDSKLTRILQSSLGGNAKTCIICTITPAEVVESHSTLRFASRAMTVKNRPKVNEVLVGEDALNKRLKSMELENIKLRKKLEEGLPADERHQLTIQLATAEREKNDLEKRLQALENYIKSSSAGKVQEKKSQKQASNRRMTVCCPRSSSSESAVKSWSPKPSLREQPLLHPGSPLVKRIKVSFPSGGGTGVGLSPFTKRGSLGEQSYMTREYGEMDEMSFVTTRKKRVSFLPTLVSTPMHCCHQDSLESMDSRFQLVDAQVQTDNEVWPLENCLMTEEVLTEKQPDQHRVREVRSVEIQTESSEMGKTLSMEESVNIDTEGSTSFCSTVNIVAEEPTFVCSVDKSGNFAAEDPTSVCLMEELVKVGAEESPSDCCMDESVKVDAEKSVSVCPMDESVKVDAKQSSSDCCMDESVKVGAKGSSFVCSMNDSLTTVVEKYTPVSFVDESVQVGTEAPTAVCFLNKSVEVQMDESPSAEAVLRSQVEELTRELMAFKSEYASMRDRLKNTQVECDGACMEAAELKRELLVLHRKLQQSTPTKFNAPSITLHSSLAVSSLGTVTLADVQTTSSPEELKSTFTDRVQSMENTKSEVPVESTPEQAIELDENVSEDKLLSVSNDSQISSSKPVSSTPALHSTSVIGSQNQNLSQISSVKMGSTPSVDSAPVLSLFSSNTNTITPPSRTMFRPDRVASSLRKRRAADLMSTLEFENEELKMLVEDSTGQIEALQKVIQDKDVKLNDYQDQMLALRTQIEDKESTYGFQDELLMKLQSQLQANQRKLEELCEKNHDLEQQLSENRSTEHQFSENVPMVCNVLDEEDMMQDGLQKGACNLQDELMAAESENYRVEAEKMEEELQRLQQRLDDKEEELRNHEDYLKREIQLLKQENSSLLDQLAAAESWESQSKAELEEVKQKASIVEKEMELLKQENVCLSDNMKAAESLKMQSKIELEQLREELQTVILEKKDIQSTQASIVEKEMELLKQENICLSDNMKAAESLEMQYKIELEQLKKELQTVIQEKEDILSTRGRHQASLELKLESIKEENSALLESIKVGQASENQYKNRMEMFETEVHETCLQLEQKEEQLLSVQNTLESLQQENAVLSERLNVVEGEKRSEMENLQKQIQANLLEKESILSRQHEHCLALEKQLESLRKENVALLDKLNEGVLEKEVQLLKQENSSLLDSLAAAQSCESQSKFELEQLRQKATVLEREMEFFRQENICLSDNMKAAESLEMQRKVELEELKKKFQTILQEKEDMLSTQGRQQTSLEMKLESLKEQNDALLENIKEGHTSENQYMNRIETLEKEAQRTHLSVEEKKEELQSMQKNLETLRQEKAALLDGISMAEEEKRIEMENLRKEFQVHLLEKEDILSKQREQCTAYEMQLGSLREENVAFLDELNTIKFSESENVIKIEKLQKEVKEMLEKLEQKDKLLSNQHEQCTAYEMQLESLREENVTFLDELNTIKFSESENVIKIEKLQKEVKEMLEKLEQKDKLLSDQLEQCAAFEMQLESLTEENVTLLDELNTIKWSESQNVMKIGKLEEKIQGMLEEKEQNNTLSANQHQNTGAEKELQQKNKQLADQLQEELEDLKEENFSLWDKLQTAEFQIRHGTKTEELEKEIQELQQRLDQKELANQNALAAELTIAKQKNATLEQEYEQLRKTYGELLQKSSNKENLGKERHQLDLQLKEVPYYQPRLSKEAELESRVYQLEQELDTVSKLHATLKRSYQAMAAVSGTSTEPIVDGSGAVTGMAFHHLKHELNLTKMEKEEFNKKYVKYLQEVKKERATSQKLKNERNMFRIKYATMKDTCTCGAAVRMKEDAIAQLSSQSNSASDPSALNDSASVRKGPSKDPLVPTKPPPFNAKASSETSVFSDAKTTASQNLLWNEPLQDKDKKKQLQECKTQ